MANLQEKSSFFVCRKEKSIFVFVKTYNQSIMKSKLILLLLLFVSASYAQQNVLSKQSALVSPQVNEDNSVTFRLYAPKAKFVEVLGDWEALNGKGIMVKGKDGVWEYSTPVLPSEMYTYRFKIDGVVVTDPTNPFVRRDVGNQFSVFFIGNGCADYYQVRDVPHGSMTTTWYHSNQMNADRRISIYTPPFYGKMNKSYPVLYLLHGSGGDELAWVELGNVARIMDNLIAEGKAEPMIVVMPNGNVSKQAAPGETPETLAYRPVSTNQLPGYKNGVYETAFTEIVNFVDATYRTIPDKKHRAVAGLSMGGFHTLFISTNHPTLFDYVGMFSAGINFTSVNMELPAYADLDGKLKNFHEVGYRLFWIACGNTDFLYEANKDFLKRLDALGVPYEYHESSRGHLWANWRQYMLKFVPMLFK